VTAETTSASCLRCDLPRRSGVGLVEDLEDAAAATAAASRSSMRASPAS
jgi:hypothetical protein